MNPTCKCLPIEYRGKQIIIHSDQCKGYDLDPIGLRILKSIYQNTKEIAERDKARP